MKIILTDYEADYWIGILPHEKEAAQRLRFNITVDCQDPGPVAEHLDTSFDYRALLDELAALQHVPIDLLETLLERLADRCFAASPLVLTVTAQVEKLALLPAPARIGIQRTFSRPSPSL